MRPPARLFDKKSQGFHFDMSLSLSSRNGRAAALMAVAVFFWSSLSLFVAWGDGGDSPFLFAAAWKAGAGLACVLFLGVVHRPLVFSWDAWRAARRKSAGWSLPLWVASYFNTALYAWSTKFIDVSVVAALSETHLALVTLVTAFLFRGQGRYRRMTPLSVSLFAPAFAGAACVVASQAGGLGGFSSAAKLPLFSLMSGFGLVLGSVLLAPLSAYGFRWASEVASEISETRDGKRESLEIFGIVLGIALCNALNFPLTALIGLARGESISRASVAFGAAGGFWAWGLGSIAWRWGNLAARDLEMNAIMYLSPALALGWLWAFSQIGADVHLGFLAAGLALIIAANAGAGATVSRR